jgi:predicted transposase/invertase (TIGR01784 family)
MLQVNDVRQTRVFQAALEEGMEKGREEELQKGREEERKAIVAEPLEIGRPADEIAKVTGLAVSEIRKLKKKKQGGSQKSKM